MELAAIGVAAGLIGALALSRAIASLLFGVTATDPLTFTAVALILGLVAFTATVIPARRATSVDPMVALRDE
jgi:ABC-type antimicrobial peptide transport system permease subunit